MDSTILENFIYNPDLWRVLIGTSAGAGLAFFFQNMRENKHETNRNAATLNEMIIHLINQLRYLEAIQGQHIDECKEKVEKLQKPFLPWLHIKSITKGFSRYSQINPSELEFLIQKEHINILGSIIDTKNIYNKVVVALDSHSDHHSNELQAKLEEFEKIHSLINDVELLPKFIGNRLFYTLKGNAKAIMSKTPEAIKKHTDVIIELSEVGIKIFPKNKIMPARMENGKLVTK